MAFMFSLDFLTADDALAHALGEQLARMDCVCARFKAFDQARRAWAARPPVLVVIDAALAAGADRAVWEKDVSGLGAPACVVWLGAPSEDVASQNAVVFQKPARLGALLQHLEWAQREAERGAGKSYRLGPWLFDSKARTLAREGAACRLTEKEAALLATLCAAPVPLAREALLKQVWGYDAGLETHTLETHLTTLRRKLEAGRLLPDPFRVEAGTYVLDGAIEI
jgi:DNA-binding response OmpR family regulator